MSILCASLDAHQYPWRWWWRHCIIMFGPLLHVIFHTFSKPWRWWWYCCTPQYACYDIFVPDTCELWCRWGILISDSFMNPSHYSILHNLLSAHHHFQWWWWWSQHHIASGHFLHNPHNSIFHTSLDAEHRWMRYNPVSDHTVHSSRYAFRPTLDDTRRRV